MRKIHGISNTEAVKIKTKIDKESKISLFITYIFITAFFNFHVIRHSYRFTRQPTRLAGAAGFNPIQ